MREVNPSRLFKLIAVLVIIGILTLNLNGYSTGITEASVNSAAGVKTLAVQSFFQQEMMTPVVSQYRTEQLEQGALLGAVLLVGEFLFKGLTFNDLNSDLAHQEFSKVNKRLNESGLSIEFSRIAPFSYLKKVFEEGQEDISPFQKYDGFQQNITQDDVLVIPYKTSEGTTNMVFIARSSSLEARQEINDLPGVAWQIRGEDLSDQYTLKKLVWEQEKKQLKEPVAGDDIKLSDAGRRLSGIPTKEVIMPTRKRTVEAKPGKLLRDSKGRFVAKPESSPEEILSVIERNPYLYNLAELGHLTVGAYRIYDRRVSRSTNLEAFRQLEAEGKLVRGERSGEWGFHQKYWSGEGEKSAEDLADLFGEAKRLMLRSSGDGIERSPSAKVNESGEQDPGQLLRLKADKGLLVLGDLHSDAMALASLLPVVERALQEGRRVVLLGDVVSTTSETDQSFFTAHLEMPPRDYESYSRISGRRTLWLLRRIAELKRDYRDRFFMLAGNSELGFRRKKGVSQFNEDINDLGGTDLKIAVEDFIDSLPLFALVEVGQENYLLSHGGVVFQGDEGGKETIEADALISFKRFGVSVKPEGEKFYSDEGQFVEHAYINNAEDQIVRGVDFGGQQGIVEVASQITGHVHFFGEKHDQEVKGLLGMTVLDDNGNKLSAGFNRETGVYILESYNLNDRYAYMDITKQGVSVKSEIPLRRVDPEYLAPVFAEFNMIPSYTIDTRLTLEERGAQMHPSPLSVEVPEISSELGEKLTRYVFTERMKTYHMMLVSKEKGAGSKLFFLTDEDADDKIDSPELYENLQAYPSDHPISLHLGLGVKDFELDDEKGSSGEEIKVIKRAPLGKGRAEIYELVVERINRFKDRLREHGIYNRILLENGDYFPGNIHVYDPQFIRDVAEETGCGLLIDLMHVACSALHTKEEEGYEYLKGKSPLDYMKDLVDEHNIADVAELHIDVPGRNTQGEWKHSGLEGAGVMDFYKNTEGRLVIESLIAYIVGLRKKTKTETPLIMNFEGQDANSRKNVAALAEFLNSLAALSPEEQIEFAEIADQKFTKREEIRLLFEDYLKMKEDDGVEEAELKDKLMKIKLLTEKIHRLIARGEALTGEFSESIQYDTSDDEITAPEMLKFLEKHSLLGVMDVDVWYMQQRTESKDGAWWKFSSPEYNIPHPESGVDMRISRKEHMRHMAEAGEDLINARFERFLASVYWEISGNKKEIELQQAGGTRPDVTIARFENLVQLISAADLDDRDKYALRLGLVLHDYGRIAEGPFSMNLETGELGPKLAGWGLMHRHSGRYLGRELLEALNVDEYTKKVVDLIIRHHSSFWDIYTAKYGPQFTTGTSVETIVSDVEEFLEGLDKDAGITGEAREKKKRAVLAMLAVTTLSDVYSSGDRYITDNFVRSIEDSIEEAKGLLSEPVEVPWLLNATEGIINNRRDLLVNIAEDILAHPSVNAESFDDEDMTAVELIDELEKVTEAVRALEEEGELPHDLAQKAERINGQLPYLEAESILSSALALQRKNQERVRLRDGEQREMVIGIDVSSWIPGYSDKGYQYEAINPLISQIRNLQSKLRSEELLNVRIVFKEELESEDHWADAMGLPGHTDSSESFDCSNVIIFGGQELINNIEESRLVGIPDEIRPFIASVDATELFKAYQKNGEQIDKQLRIELLRMLLITMMMATGESWDAAKFPIELEYDSARRRITFVPMAEPIEFGVLRGEYEGKLQALRSL